MTDKISSHGDDTPHMTFAPDAAPPSGALLWPVRHPRAAIFVTLLLSVLALLSVLRIRPDTSLEGLFPRGDRSARALSHVLKDFSVAEELLLLVTIPDPGVDRRAGSSRDDPPAPTTANLLAFAERLEQSVKNDPEASKLAEAVIYRPDAQTEAFFREVVVPNGLFYLDDAEFAAVRQRLTKEGMADQIRRNEQMIATPGPAGGMAKELLKDPLRLREFLLPRLARAQGTFKTRTETNALVSRDGKALLIRLPGRGPVSDMDFTKAFVGKMRTLADRANVDGLQLDFSGAYAIAAESERNIRSDAISSTFTSMLYLTILFFVMYRGAIKLFLLAFTPVALGNLLGFGLYATWSTALTPMTAVIGAMLAEMGINYSIHYLTLYDAAHAGGHTAKHAAGRATREIALPLLAAYCTSIVGFFAVGFSSLQVLREFAVLGSFALAGAVATTLLLLPAVLVLLDGRKKLKAARAAQDINALTPSPGIPGRGRG